MRTILKCTLLLALTLALGSGCGRFRNQDQIPHVQEEQVEAGSVDQYETQLRDMVSRRITQIEQSRENDKTRVLHRQPYFYKEYSTYTGSAQSAEIDIRETGSRTRPYEGKVEVAKIRYATKMHLGRADATNDTNFIRQTGTEVLNYELRNGRWNRIGSIFVVDIAEEQVNSQWVTVQEERAEELMKEPEVQRGFFGGLWDRVSGK